MSDVSSDMSGVSSELLLGDRIKVRVRPRIRVRVRVRVRFRVRVRVGIGWGSGEGGRIDLSVHSSTAFLSSKTDSGDHSMSILSVVG